MLGRVHTHDACRLLPGMAKWVAGQGKTGQEEEGGARFRLYVWVHHAYHAPWNGAELER